MMMISRSQREHYQSRPPTRSRRSTLLLPKHLRSCLNMIMIKRTRNRTKICMCMNIVIAISTANPHNSRSQWPWLQPYLMFRIHIWIQRWKICLPIYYGILYVYVACSKIHVIVRIHIRLTYRLCVQIIMIRSMFLLQIGYISSYITTNIFIVHMWLFNKC